MAYETKDLIEKSLNALEENPNVMFIEDLSMLIGINKATFYSHGLNENDDIKEKILKNKLFIKQNLICKWQKNDNATTDLALYKLASNDKEFAKLTSQKIDVDVKDERSAVLEAARKRAFEEDK